MAKHGEKKHGRQQDVMPFECFADFKLRGVLYTSVTCFRAWIIVFASLPSAETIRNFPSVASNSMNPREIENTIFVRASNEVRNPPNMELVN